MIAARLPDPHNTENKTNVNREVTMCTDNDKTKHDKSTLMTAKDTTISKKGKKE